jgi:cytochrome c-type biogenesis protein
MSVNKSPLQESIPTLSYPKRKLKKFLLPGFLLLGTLLLILLAPQLEQASGSLERLISLAENNYRQWFEQQRTDSPLILLSLAFGGGLLASVSPCILALLPVNLAYIGTLKINSRWDAFRQAGFFVLGAVTILSILGLFSSLAAAIFVEWRGLIQIAVGSLILGMGLSFAGLFHLPLPQMNLSLPIAGPYGVGLTFALVSSPCASPVLFAVLAAAAASGSQLLSVLTMVSYGLGYTAVIFLASLFTGFAKQARSLLHYSDWIIRLGSAVLILAGGYYLVSGIRWVF